jgi:FkbM family methyltransferase
VLLKIIRLLRNWPVYFIQKFFDVPVLYHLRGDGRGFSANQDIPPFYWRDRDARFETGLWLLCRPEDRAALVDVWLNQSYDPNAFDVPYDWNSCTRIIDVGAHIGCFTLFAVSKAPRATVLAFEPAPSNYEYLWLNTRHYKNVVLSNAAIGAKKGDALLQMHDSGGHSLVRQAENQVEVPVVPLGDYLNEPCDLLKMDCEGAEYEALYSLNDDQCRNVRFLALEYHHFSKQAGHSPNVLTQWLDARGFEIKMHRKSMLLAWRPRRGES